jgi:hypothetical protein
LEEAINKAVEFLFLQNGIVSIPIFSTMLVILFKAVSYRGELDSDSLKSMLNIGLDLATAGIFVLLTNISFSVALIINNQSDDIDNLVYSNLFLHGTKILLYIVIVLVFSLSIKYFSWDKNTASMKNTWGTVIIKDIIGIFLLALSIIFAGGNVR